MDAAQELTSNGHCISLVSLRGKGIYASDESPDAMTAILNTLAVMLDDGSGKQSSEKKNGKNSLIKPFQVVGIF